MDPVLDPPPPPGNGNSTAQNQIEAVAEAILASVQANGYSGFTGLVADGAGSSLLLYWLAGEPLPADIAAIVASPGQPITVTRIDASYSQSYLNSRADILTGATGLSDQICGLLHTVIVPEEGTGLRVEAQPYDGVDPSTFVSVTATVLGQLAGVPVVVTISPVPTETGRQDDQAPWWAGARITAPGKGLCSDAFGVLRVADSNKPYVLTAAHCYTPGTQVFNGVRVGMPGRRLIGTVRDFLPGFDSELIEIDPREGVRPAVFNGEWDDGVFISPVRTTGANIKGLLMFVCTSGASTGQNCLLNIQNTNVRILNISLSTLTHLQWTTNLVTAEPIFLRRIFKGVAVGTGDSGGPVIQYTDSVSAKAMGTIVAGSHTTPCGRAAPGVTCFSRVYYADINNLLNVYGVGLVQ